MVGDVGATIAEIVFEAPGCGRVRPIPALEPEIDRLWADAGPRVRAALDGAPGLALLPAPFRFRVSHDYDSAAFDAGVIATVAALGHDHPISADRFFDVPPQERLQGPVAAPPSAPSRRRRVPHPRRRRHARRPLHARLRRFRGRRRRFGPVLIAELGEAPHLHRVEALGAGGILEAIVALGLHPASPQPEASR